MPSDFRLIATATFGLESVVARELSALGYESRVVRPGWLSFAGDEGAVARANLWLRASDRVLLELAVFQATDFGTLFDATRAVAWEALLPRNARVPVRGRSIKSQLASVPACQRIVKKALAERLQSAHGLESLPEDGPTFPVEIALVKDEAYLVLDTTGPGLHKRGYRPESGPAPLKETLAAGLVLLSGWKGDRPFLDPFCGTGTIAIEAALLGRNRAPGLGRDFLAESWPSIPGSTWTRAREEARELEGPSLAEPIEASDRDKDSLRIGRGSAEKASVAREIRFERKEFSSVSSERTYGYLVTNPSYGERSGEADEVLRLYRAMPEVFRRLPTWSFFVLTAQRDFERVLGQEATRRRKLYNGDVECHYYQFFGPRPGKAGASARQAFGGIDARAEGQAEIFANRLRKRAHHLRKWPTKRETDCYRLYERDIKEVPLVVDRYGDAILITPPGDRLESRTRAEHEDWLDLMARAAAETLGVSASDVVVRGRRHEPRIVAVREPGLLFEARLSGDGEPGLDPGLRVLRRWVREEALDKSVLVFPSGAGAFGVAAALGNARTTVNVDPDPSAREWARRNFALNGIDVAQHRFICAEAEEFLRGDDGVYDLCVTEARSPDGYVSISDLVSARMAPGGGVLLLTRAPRPKLDLEALPAWHVEDVTSPSFPEEFRSRKIHRAWRLTKRG